MPSSLNSNGRIRKRKFRRNKVLKLLTAVMEQAAASTNQPSASDAHHNDFFNTGRVGRRNALPDILNNHCMTSTADLPDKLSALSTNDPIDTSQTSQNETNIQHSNASSSSSASSSSAS